MGISFYFHQSSQEGKTDNIGIVYLISQLIWLAFIALWVEKMKIQLTGGGQKNYIQTENMAIFKAIVFLHVRVRFM